MQQKFEINLDFPFLNPPFDLDTSTDKYLLLAPLGASFQMASLKTMKHLILPLYFIIIIIIIINLISAF